MSDFQHNEAFCLMNYQCSECNHVEVLWNSRDGVTPFGIACQACGGHEAYHVKWDSDVRAQDFAAVLARYPTVRVFVDASPYHQHLQDAARDYVEKYWDYSDTLAMRWTMFLMDKAAAAEHFLKEWTKPGSPTIITSQQFLREHVRNV